MSYLTVGTDTIYGDSFLPIQDSDLTGSIKPRGGLWLTEFDMRCSNYNSWVDFMVVHPYILFYKNKGRNPFQQPCSVVFLKENAPIFRLSTREDYQFLLMNYSDDVNKFSFERLSLDFDGVYVDILNLNRELELEDFNLFSSFGVNSLILFSPECIDYYYSGVVQIEPFDYECHMHDEFVFYDIKWNQDKNYIDRESLFKKRRSLKIN